MDMFQPQNISDWHEWLVKNHANSKGIWLVYVKSKDTENVLNYEQTVEEALCFGWIDGLIKRLDGDHYVRKFTPRNAGSKWSALNLARAKRMVEQGRMTEHGAELYHEGLLHEKPGTPSRRQEQEGFRKGLEKLLTDEILGLYHTLPDSLQRQYAGWVMSAKKDETRQKRIEELSATISRGERLGLK